MKNINEQINDSSTSDIRITDAGFEKDYRFDESFIGFDGHFPGHPILPAIVQIMIACHGISHQYGKPLVVASINRAKFQKIVGPDMTIIAKWIITPKQDAFQCRCSLIHDDQPVSTFTLLMNEMDNADA